MFAWAWLELKIGWPTTSRHARGYGSEWTKRRERILARDRGICQPCLKLGNLHRGSEVDHIVPKSKGGTDDDSNLQTICREAHKAKTVTEQGKEYKPKQTIGIDGFPI